MEKALKRLNRLITATVEPAMVQTAPHDAGKMSAWVYTVIDECEKIQDDIVQNTCCAKDRKRYSLLMHYYQSSLVHLSDLLYKYRLAPQDEVLSTLYNTVSLSVDNLMQYVKHRYPEFFNIHGKVPDKEQHFARQNIAQGWPRLRQRLLERGIESELVDIIMEPVNGLLSAQEPAQITWYRLAHIKELLLELDAWCGSADENPEWSLIARLLYVNLNSAAFYNYCRKYIDAQVASADDLQEKLDRVRALYKGFRYDLVKPGIGYDAGMTDFRTKLTSLLMSEIHFLEADQKLFFKWQEKMKKTLNGVITKIKSNLTVAEWGIWLRGEMHCGMLLNEDMVELKALVETLFETLRQKQVSFFSMREKSAAISNKSREKLMKMAMDMYLFFKHYGKGYTYESGVWKR